MNVTSRLFWAASTLSLVVLMFLLSRLILQISAPFVGIESNTIEFRLMNLMIFFGSLAGYALGFSITARSLMDYCEDHNKNIFALLLTISFCLIFFMFVGAFVFLSYRMYSWNHVHPIYPISAFALPMCIAGLITFVGLRRASRTQ
jgi:hypothetical protein